MSAKKLPPRQQTAPEPEPDIGPRAAVRSEFARRLQERMLSHKPLPFSQADLARASHCGRDAVSTYVRGISMPGPKALKQLSDALGCQPEDLMPPGASNENEAPAFQVRQMAGADRVWLTVNQPVSKDQAAAITAILMGVR
jgi:transcriptional regulator with XRE-family HTH domain